MHLFNVKNEGDETQTEANWPIIRSKEEADEVGREFRENHKEEKKEYDKAYRENNKEHRQEISRIYRESNRDKLLAKLCLW